MNKKRLITSIAVGTIALVGLSVSLTLAWYGASDRLNIRSLDVAVAGQTELKISTTGEIGTYYSDLDLSPAEEEFVFVPVSSMNKKGWMENKSDTPLFYDCSSSLVPSNGEPASENATYGFFQKKLYLLTSLDYYVSLDVDPESQAHSLFEANDEVNTARAQQLKRENPDWTLTVNEIKDKLDSLINCLRVSILVTEENHYNYYIVDPFKGGVTTLGGRLDNNRDGYYDTYRTISGENKEVIYGEINDRSKIVYDDPMGGEDEKIEQADHYFGNSFDAISKKNAYTYNKEASEANGLEFAKEESLSLNEIDSEATKLLIPCYGGKPTEIVLSIYLEGWDLDCINSTMGASFKTKLSFKLLRGIIG